MFGHEPLVDRLMKKGNFNDRPQPGFNRYTVIPDSEDESDDDGVKTVDVEDQRLRTETITVESSLSHKSSWESAPDKQIHSAQNDSSPISVENNQKRKRHPKGLESEFSRVDAMTENDMRRKRKALRPNKASHHPGEIDYIRTVIDVFKNRLPDYTEDRQHNAQKVISLMKKNIESHERLIEVEEEKLQLMKANLELEREKLKLEKKNLENEKLLDENESRQAIVLVRILERKLEDAGAQ
ncbi:hypothetical protein T440DRAFT_484097 [Plenodomus tracheiphilus IPT5]|uniref:Uncharacterized protein n=1 Tax=Plenodomus tracheiphilus IPT5 TaxID=1408161 RepID=A0A6A7ANA1_9PLEO|nr:hypothetical protein T440DRAFT_484097 [Plenodomus tracheiphilus IPT5]